MPKSKLRKNHKEKVRLRFLRRNEELSRVRNIGKRAQEQAMLALQEEE